MVEWFRSMFEDPQNQTPYAIDKESPYNYEYIWGGPYFARDELYHQFGDEVSEAILERAIQEVERDGIIEWAPTWTNPDHLGGRGKAIAEDIDFSAPSLDEIEQSLENETILQFGDPQELKIREALRAELQDLRTLLSQQANLHGGIGHNNPPEPTALNSEETITVATAVDQIDVELNNSTPDVSVIIKSARILQTALHWLAAKIDKSIDAFAKAIGSASGVAIAADIAGIPVAEKISRVVDLVREWVSTINTPF